MLLPNGTIVAVADGDKLNLFRNTGDEIHPALTSMDEPEIEPLRKHSGASHQSNPADLDESRFAVGIAGLLNKLVLDGKISDLIIIAAPHALGYLRKGYHKKLLAILRGEIPKDLTGHTAHDIERAIAAV